MEIREYSYDNIVHNKPLPRSELSELKEVVSKCWQTVAPSWSIKNFVASNPLKGYEHMTFEEALKVGKQYYENKKICEPLLESNRHMIKWCKVLFDQGQASLAAPNKEQRFYHAWRKLALHDVCLTKKKKSKINWLQSLPDDSTAALRLVLNQLQISDEARSSLFITLLATLPGWAAHAKSVSNSKNNAQSKYILMDYMAVRVIILSLCGSPDLNVDLIIKHFGAEEDESIQKKLTEIEKEEKKHIDQLVWDIQSNLPCSKATKSKNILAQWVFCIDVRSEGVRHRLEQLGGYETFGMAGFFGMPVAIHNSLKNGQKELCPVLISPSIEVKQELDSHEMKRAYQRSHMTQKTYAKLKSAFSAPFALAESTGIIHGLFAWFKTFFPTWTHKVSANFTPNIDAPEHNVFDLSAMSLSEKVSAASMALSAIGLTKDFSDVVILCGHHSVTTNNAFASYLQCGACGANPGTTNPLLLSNILNERAVREALVYKGISIPETTVFLSASHNTTSEEIKLIHRHRYAQHRHALDKIEQDLMRIHGKDAKERRQLMRRQSDWAQIRPEWGLAGNTAFVIGPRDITKHLDLRSRVFLHSYQHESDPHHDILHQIMNAPLIVAQWINMQYFFSTLNNVAYGAGSKLTKNVVGKLGVMQGNASDLMHGLPLESVYLNEEESYHKLTRLHGIVYAPLKALKNVLAKSKALRELCKNQWLFLVCIDPITQTAYQFSNGTWIKQ